MLRWNREEKLLEKQCRKCGEWWPATAEFWPRKTTGYLCGPCKACVQEHRYATNAARPCCVPGCNEPRRVTKDGVRRYSRCLKHDRERQRARWRVYRKGATAPHP